MSSHHLLAKLALKDFPAFDSPYIFFYCDLTIDSVGVSHCITGMRDPADLMAIQDYSWKFECFARDLKYSVD